MAYTPSTLTVGTWASPFVIQGTDLIADLDNTMNSIISTHANSLKNFVNTELAKVPTYLSTELALVYAETNNSAVSAASSAATATTKAVEALASANSAAQSLASTNGLINTGLPLQAGNTGKFLSTDGNSASWQAVPNPNLSVMLIQSQLNYGGF